MSRGRQTAARSGQGRIQVTTWRCPQIHYFQHYKHNITNITQCMVQNTNFDVCPQKYPVWIRLWIWRRQGRGRIYATSDVLSDALTMATCRAWWWGLDETGRRATRERALAHARARARCRELLGYERCSFSVFKHRGARVDWKDERGCKGSENTVLVK